MVPWKSLVVDYLFATGVCVAVAVERQGFEGGPLMARAPPPSASAPFVGYYNYFWTDGSGNVTYTNGGGGTYKISASADAAHWIGGKGWNTGISYSISFSADFRVNNKGILGVYGWTVNPLIEYYVVEKYVGFYPVSGGRLVGQVVSDGSVYDVVTLTRVNQPSIRGTATYMQVRSIRSSHRTSGAVTLANHFNAWKSLGILLGSFEYQIFAAEGFYSVSNVAVTIADGPGATTTNPVSTTSTISSQRTTTSLI
ncbi:Endo-1,4-beta-xylanase A Short=Xylanase A; AltName: Full=1,4-beta-D-xylan xylanohydrolase A; Flags: Precursor [Serendipita indica DSM 11827]|nr:Endo-1,4-beta-xylanase A Short=Xylanase A; AltName: Full=1,4-beta-D-xylan xylanohydrolase A; Flags: Precursor [Serendipita indica DSM 11827]